MKKKKFSSRIIYTFRAKAYRKKKKNSLAFSSSLEIYRDIKFILSPYSVPPFEMNFSCHQTWRNNAMKGEFYFVKKKERERERLHIPYGHLTIRP